DSVGTQSVATMLKISVAQHAVDIADIGSPTGEGTRDESGAADRLRRSGGVGFPCAPAGLTH
ncbi:hypothetical protein, partial [Mycobacterium sp.]|uniref:hypothetical protein n=1 Tax=Mycobacterium sp. TaxID=1785 RepID=UPI003C71BCCF